MKDILFINACVRKQSRTRKLAQKLVDKLNGKVTEIKLGENRIRPLDTVSLNEREELLSQGSFSEPQFKAANEFANADIIIIAAPYWDLTFPSVLKIYLENITVCGVTFKYTNSGIAEGLCKAKKLYYVTTSGGPIVHNFGYEYVKTLCEEFYGINEIRFIGAEGLDIVGADADKILNKAIKGIKP